MINMPLATAPRSMNGNSIAGELHRTRERNVQLELENAGLKRRADKYEQLFYAALSLSALIGSVFMLWALG